MTGVRAWVSSRRSGLLIATGLVAATVVVVLGAGGPRTTIALDPDNPDPGGAQALARVLAHQGIELRVVRSAEAFDAAPVDNRTTVLVTSTERLGRSTTNRLLEHSRAATLVLAGPGPGTTRALGVRRLPFQVTVRDPRSAACTDPTYDGLALQVDHALEYPSRTGCFGGEHGALVVEPRAGVVLFGAAEAFTNDQILRADNAAAALRLLGQRERLVWYVPDAGDLVGSDGVSLQTLLPRWVHPGLWLGTIAVLSLVLWRSRRLGPLASEPLPVVVKAIETTRSRGRLYRRSGDRGHAAEALRSAARVRAAERLGLGVGIDAATLVRDLARHLDRPAAELEELLGTAAPPPTSDHDLITLAGRLAELDREVRRP